MASHVYDFILGLLCVLLVTIFTLYRYGNIRKQHVVVTVVTLIAWYFSFIIVFVLPLDVSATMYKQCLTDCNISSPSSPTAAPATSTPVITTSTTEMSVAKRSIEVDDASCSCVEPWVSLPDVVLRVFWKIVYWSAQLLTWLILPLMQSYASAGEFSVLGKMRSALISNAIYYATYAVIFCVCLIYVATRPNLSINAENLKVIGITASNTWGLFLLVLLYGYGLVDIPRALWQSSHAHYMLNQVYFKIAKISMEHSEAEEKFEDTLEEVRRAAEAVKYNHPYRKYVDTILKKCPDEFVKSLRRNDDYVEYNESDVSIPTEKALIKMHLNIISASRNYVRTQSQKKMLIQKAMTLEDDIANQNSSNKYYKRSAGKYNGYFKIIYSPKLEWWWRITIRPILLKLASVVLAIFSVMVVWSECVFFVPQPVLSLFAIFIRLGSSHFTNVSIEVISILVLAYLCVCAYRTVFKIRVFNYYHVAPAHQTDENSLLFSGMLLSRLTPPLCLNFLCLIQLDSHVTKEEDVEETTYTEIMGHMDVISFISDGFNIYFPIAIVLLCIATTLRLGSRLLHCIGFEQFIDDDITQEIVDEGRNHVQREKVQMGREQARIQRRSDWENTLNRSQLGNRPCVPLKEWNDYESCSSTRKNRQAPIHSQRTTSKKGGARTGDRMELLSDQDVVEYDSNADYDNAPQRATNSRNIFNDL
ncbi:G-protein coupled receptor-associated protein LMBRD2-like isoform X2 [Watersipora subatra]|uniref:G-protein coupled receptor-associated protein LMBRD2-like isoform X2 n=1 Tax=Watersipora subatra TaxID=2589382 RepID=UPI00355C986F